MIISLLALGGMYGASLSTIKSRLLPHLGSSYFGTAVTSDASLAVLAKEREVSLAFIGLYIVGRAVVVLT